jgi:hypothetical protein
MLVGNCDSVMGADPERNTVAIIVGGVPLLPVRPKAFARTLVIRKLENEKSELGARRVTPLHSSVLAEFNCPY